MPGQLTPAKLLFKPMSAMVGIAGFASAGGTSESVKTALLAALATAGDGGIQVPLQAGAYSRNQGSFVEGVDVADGLNRVTVYVSGTGKRAQDGNGNDVYAKITTSGADWTLAYFSRIGGAETAFAVAAGATLDLEIPYLFTLDHYPARSGTAPTERHVAPDLAAYGWREQIDALTVSSTNTVSTKLTKTYDGRKATVLLYGLAFSDKGASPSFSIAGDGTLTWNAANAGVQLDPGDPLIIVYTF